MDRRLGRLLLAFSFLVRATGLSLAAVVAPDLGLLKEQNRIKEESELRIQRDILDPILGKGSAMPFVDVEMEVKLEDEQSTRSGMGLAEKYREKLAQSKQGSLQSLEVMPGIPKPKTISANDNNKPEAAQAQQASQVKGVQEERFAVKPVFKRMSVTIIHDDAVLKNKTQIDLVRSRILEVMKPYGLSDDNIFFRPTQFKKIQIDWRDDLKKPEVYLPLLFAILTLLFLLFLFGPLWRFFREYVKALKEKPAAEVNVESKIEPPKKEYDEMGNLIKEESKIEMVIQRKAPEPPPPPLPPPEDEEEDEMAKKFEPFAYINEENVRRLAYMFVLRKEEPWIIAVAASYLRPDLARQMLAALPIQMQARVAIEALTVRQVTKDQVNAIDADVKENVDFVVGGMERLTAMLDEADTATRNNILTYLKNEKPLVYEHVRKVILTFDDIVNFQDRDMQVIVRELKTEAMAKALQDAPPEVVKKFLSNMSAGASSLLKESMEYSTGLTPAQIDEERAKIMDLVKALEKEGKIVIRNKADMGGGFIEGMQEELGAQESRQKRFDAARRKADAFSNPASGASAAQPAAAAPSPEEKAQAQQYFAAGVQYHDSQQFEGALQYLQTAIQLDPSLIQAFQYLGNCFYSLGRIAEAVAAFEKVLETNPDPQLRQWVEGLKAQAR
jgi:flagellar motor switch protein FliG